MILVYERELLYECPITKFHRLMLKMQFLSLKKKETHSNGDSDHRITFLYLDTVQKVL